MDNFNQNSSFFTTQEQAASQTVARSFMANVFMWMFVALGISAVFAFLFSNNLSLLSYLISFETGKLNILGWIVMFAPLGFVLLMSFAYSRLSAPMLTLLFMLYAAINGISFSFILLAYTANSVLGCFLSASAMFGVMAVMGYTTKKDLTSFGRILMMALIGIVIAMLINMFLKSDTMGYVISIIGVMVFTGLTAYDVQKLKRIGAGIEYGDVPASEGKKLSILGALTLYLDFINIFLFLLRLFGSRRD
ncbi:Bax inhibitor-1/YccA family protein [Pseudoflavitalea sp. G-6-1-2]|uniref:Bax inhibitor-1/YccA family protein n=1 Tax=Pseudoflavitalea sp. G-6-1-2 TaxID=2728841 RepID=UPI00146A4FE2|nr:Bax inhibitor-1/YccA family protein [Pseudoflavitalea sp. G-6-1-2]NML21417.1 Bax inhibitor-1/YccA family protein [Pseudoflavitalea sp. G-6-1-2]